MSQNLSRIKFESRGLDSRQSFREWSKALECRLTALTSAMPISSATPWSSTREGHRFLYPLFGLSLPLSLFLLVLATGQAPRDQHRAASRRVAPCSISVPCTRAMSPLERIPYDATKEAAARLFSRGREKSATTQSPFIAYWTIQGDEHARPRVYRVSCDTCEKYFWGKFEKNKKTYSYLYPTFKILLAIAGVNVFQRMYKWIYVFRELDPIL